MKHPTLTIDASGLHCPMPTLKLQQGLLKVASNHLICLISTDIGSIHDVPAFCQQHGHTLIEQKQQGKHFHFVVRKK